VLSLVVTFSLLVGGAFLLLVLQSSLISAAWSNLAVRASDVARLLDEEGIHETQSTLAEDRRSGEQVQIVDSSNHVVAWSIRGCAAIPSRHYGRHRARRRRNSCHACPRSAMTMRYW
jgi:hypothetical protein